MAAEAFESAGLNVRSDDFSRGPEPSLAPPSNVMFNASSNIPEDVNADGNLTALDALLVQLSLDLVGNDAVNIDPDPPGLRDVNGNGQVEVTDYAQVINKMIEHEGELPTATESDSLEIQIDLVSPSGESLLDDQREAVLGIGDEFVLRYSYADGRATDDRLGALAFAVGMDISNLAAVELVPPPSSADYTLAGYKLTNSSTLTNTMQLPTEVGLVGPIVTDGVTADDAIIDVLEIPMRVTTTATDVTFEAGPSSLDLPALLYGRNDPLTSGQIVFGDQAKLTASFVGSTPTAANASLSIEENLSASIALLDFVSSDSTIDVIAVGAASFGTVTVNDLGVATYIPQADFFGSDTFTYTVTNQFGTDTGVVTINVVEVISPPIANDGSLSVNENDSASIALLNLVTSDSAVSFTIISSASFGTVTVNDSGVATYVPQADFFGSDTFTYAITNESGTDSGQISINVVEIISSPITVDDFISIAAERVNSIPIAELLQNDSADSANGSNTLVVTAVSEANNGTVLISGDQILYEPSVGFVGTDVFSYTVVDPNGGTATGIVTLDVAYQRELIALSLPADEANDVTIRVAGTDLEVIDNDDSNIVFRRPVEFVQSFELIGGNLSDRFTLERPDDRADPFGNFPMSLLGGDGIDAIEFDGSNLQVAVSADGPLSDADSFFLMDVGVPGEEFAHTKKLGGFEEVALTADRVELNAFEIGGVLDIASLNLLLNTSDPIRLPPSTLMAGGTLSSTASLVLPAGHVLSGHGAVDARVVSIAGSLIRAEGDLSLGHGDAVGINVQGDLAIGDHRVELLGTEAASLSGLVSLDGGELVAGAGMIIDFAAKVLGHGVIDTPETFENRLLNLGTIRGDSTELPITLGGLIKGVGTLDHVQVNGTFTPGFSPTISRNGVVIYGESSTLVIELGGSQAGTQYDQIIHQPGTVFGGKLQVELIDGYVPSVGQTHDMILIEDEFGSSTIDLNEFTQVTLPGVDDGVPVGLQWRLQILDLHAGGPSLSLGSVADVAALGGNVQVEVADGQLQVKSASGELLPTSGSVLELVADQTQDFQSSGPWEVQETLVENGSLIQIARQGELQLRIEGAGWTNFVEPFDVNGSASISALDALQIINELNNQAFTESDTVQLTDPVSLPEFPNLFFDVNRDGRVTALDALRVINRLDEIDAVASEPTEVNDSLFPPSPQTINRSVDQDDDGPLLANIDPITVIPDDLNRPQKFVSPTPEISASERKRPIENGLSDREDATDWLPNEVDLAIQLFVD